MALCTPQRRPPLRVRRRPLLLHGRRRGRPAEAAPVQGTENRGLFRVWFCHCVAAAVRLASRLNAESPSCYAGEGGGRHQPRGVVRGDVRHEAPEGAQRRDGGGEGGGELLAAAAAAHDGAGVSGDEMTGCLGMGKFLSPSVPAGLPKRGGRMLWTRMRMMPCKTTTSGDANSHRGGGDRGGVARDGS